MAKLWTIVKLLLAFLAGGTTGYLGDNVIDSVIDGLTETEVAE